MAEEGFRQRFPWIGGHLQTIRNVTMRRAGRIPPDSGQRIWLETDDGSGDVIALKLSVPENHDPDGKPLILLIHGLSGCEDSMNQRMSAAWFMGRGHAVARLNLRGAGPSEARCRKGYHSGHTADLALALLHLARDGRLVGEAGIVAMGVSLGGVILLNHLIRSGRDSGLRAAVSVSSPLDLAAASRRFMAPSNA
ncbi:MAG: alpha/beta hydrolase, partial [Rhodospirillales bacterium]